MFKQVLRDELPYEVLEDKATDGADVKLCQDYFLQCRDKNYSKRLSKI